MPTSKAEVRKMYRETVDLAISLGYEDLHRFGWTLGFNNRKRSRGICSFSKREIQISTQFMATHTAEELRGTVSHEIAHAIAGHEAGHGIKWKRVHRALGGDGQRLADVAKDQKPAHSWELINGLTGEVVVTYYRKPRRDFSRLALKGKPETRGHLTLRRA